MNYKAFSLILFVLIFCLSSTMASLRILPGSGNSKMPIQPHRPKPAGSATTQPPPAAQQHIIYRSMQKTVTVCNEKVYGNCISYPPAVRRCNSGERCVRTTVP
ncbi:hypothetical protein MTR67_021520 [Solanum verrucosum]|uniref:Uncharacterized protein n=1 Tax=Solanum verrucosum TaxID=315347 RepID=A0AAF0TVV3_SOLVR|nr:hypothetical protein MTR67_021520 [Solanum verrucosum]